MRSNPVRAQGVNRATGEVMQLDLFGEEEAKSGPDKVRYDWNPHPGRHVNVSKTLMRKLWRKDSGYDQNDRDIFGFYLAHSPDGAEPLRMTFKEISETLGPAQNTVRTSVEKLHLGGLLLEAEKFGRMRFYRVNPRAGYDGPAKKQVDATKDARFPVVPAPAADKEAPAKPARTARKRKAA
ncbi:winged helix-turn-helix domain-containing protein [Streptomyces sp. CBMA156]|uniref:winged helix-turn-helix domain-containing protein n=1 Tax=Streptomyces sp. CBMA156 TaxID=1930280 RepID=UPI00294FFB34|nr:winged helix-turn-helix domain-containing protein [Streptomyces sp. CBMA156]